MNAAWIGFVGAVVGGVLAAVGSWWATRAQEKQQVRILQLQGEQQLAAARLQAEQEREAQRFDLLDKAAAEVHIAAGRVGTALMVNKVPTEQLQNLLWATTLLTARARTTSPHLADVATELMDGLNAALAHATSNTKSLLVRDVRPASRWAMALTGLTLYWMKSPTEFDKDAPTTESILARVDEGNTGSDPS
jgi:hypothetical protein